MKTKLITLSFAILFAIGILNAQTYTRVDATNYDISDNLDLKAVASLFGKASNLDDFERRLNDPSYEISNLDLNEDGYVDYLRVVQVKIDGEYIITIQAVLGENIYQDVATINVEKQGRRKYAVHVIGNEYIYGYGYVISPVYRYRPSLLAYMFSPYYQPWNSPYYWGYYPTYYSYRTPYTVIRYHNHIYHHIDYHNHYNYSSNWNFHHSNDYHAKYSRNDYGNKHPERSFEKRNDGYKNKQELNNNRRSQRPNSSERDFEERSGQRKSVGNGDAKSFENNKKGAPYTTKKPKADQGQRRSDNREKSVSQPTQSKSKNIERSEPKKTENRSGNRERTIAQPSQSKSKNIEKSAPEKSRRTEPTKEKSTVKKAEKKSESKPKTQSSTKGTEKKDDKKKENASRR